MFYFFFDEQLKSLKETEYFISGIIVTAADQQDKKVYLDYRINEKIRADIYLPDGINILHINTKRPTIVETLLNKEINNLERKIFNIYKAQKGFKSDIIFCLANIKKDSFGRHNDRDIYSELLSIRERVINSFNNTCNIHYLFSEDFDELATKYKDQYISTLLKFKNKNLFKPLNSDKEKRNALYSIGKESKTETVFPLTEETPVNISKQNEETFKTYFKDPSQSVAIILGNGVSIPFGSDSWSDTINNMVDFLRPQFISDTNKVQNALANSSFLLSSFVKTTLENKISLNNYYDALKYCVYRKYNEQLLKKESLISTLARVKNKYINIPIATYNYDLFFEKAMEYLFGKKLTPIADGRAINYNTEILHLHGYLPMGKHYGKNIILTDQDYVSVYFKGKNSWVVDEQKKLLGQHKTLFIGSSMTDIFQMSIINDVLKEKGKSWGCYALLCLGGLNLNEKIVIMEYYSKKSINIIYVDNYDELIPKINEIFNI